jgi:hypothetical protein
MYLQHLAVDAFGHSWLVVAVSVWLVWRLRKPLLALEPHARACWGCGSGAVMTAWWLGYALEVRVLQQLAMTAAVTGITWALLGARVTWLLAFPLLYLFLTVSAWDVVNDPMQDATAWLSAHAVRARGPRLSATVPTCGSRRGASWSIRPVPACATCWPG